MKLIKKIFCFLFVFSFGVVLFIIIKHRDISSTLIEEVVYNSEDAVNQQDNSFSELSDDVLESEGISYSIEGKMDDTMLSQRCFSKTKSSYKFGEKIVIEAYMGDMYSHNQKFNVLPNYDSLGKNGYPVFYISDVADIDNIINIDGSIWGAKTTRDDSRLVINGILGYYEKAFDSRELVDLDIATSDYLDILKYHSEKVSINFDGLNKGDKGVIDIAFGWVYTKYNPYCEGSNGETCIVMNNPLFYYVGERGIGLSYNSLGEARENIKKEEEIGFLPYDDDNVCYSYTPISVCYNNKETSYLHGSLIHRSFSVINSYYDEGITISVDVDDGISILTPTNYEFNGKDISEFSVDFYLEDNFDTGRISIKVEGRNDSLALQPYCDIYIYCLHNNQNDYISNNSLDELAVYSEKLKRELDAIDRKGEFVSVKHNAGMRPSSYTVKGYIYWTDSSGTTHPARNIELEIRGTNNSPSTSWLLGSTTTNDTGFYTKTIPISGSGGIGENFFIRVKSKGLNINVVNASGTVYAYNSGIYYSPYSGDDITISYTANKTTDLGKSLGAHQALELGNRYMYSLENTYMTDVDVCFPDSSQSICCYTPSNNTIHILAGSVFAWDVLLHEYGHFIQHCYGITNSPGLQHSPIVNLADELENKSQGINLAWGEGWATYFSINSQVKMNASVMNIPTVGNTQYNNLAGLNIDVENIGPIYRKGEANEIAVAATLYDLTDGVSTSDHDYVSLLNSTVWNYTVNNNCTTLSELMYVIYNSYIGIQTKLKTGNTLAFHNISANLNSSIIGIDSSNPTFSWDKQGGSTSCPNNNFKLAFYDSSYNLILKTSSVNATSYTLTSSQWNTIKSTGSVVYCCVETMQTYYPSTGPYYSNLITINIPS